jgi:peptidoglycan/xylan/chitin deacetylase (PgdA/CDA1 family)
VIWNVDTLDWKAGTTLNTADSTAIRTRARSGSTLAHPVILFHDGGASRPNMLHELPGIITYYRSLGYTFVGLDGRAAAAPRCDVFTLRSMTVGSATCAP